ncbi:hypothetical protein IQ235_03385 [Oscillatoriales cyanobacterium LEGE 11467]|uniref:Uncharacterized protein n=1 Tax=Zarconia navalis LEGE 11467 TaxID=1828826 RepID=A0A928Z6S8_9CYAN|nr:hypothetical protein [Zarconia navalis]MBE9039835.1 hypothetical protein [Zarconia navalis LEGE 11467]
MQISQRNNLFTELTTEEAATVNGAHGYYYYRPRYVSYGQGYGYGYGQGQGGYRGGTTNVTQNVNVRLVVAGEEIEDVTINQ